MSNFHKAWLTVDRIEGRTAIIVAELRDDVYPVLLEELPAGTVEGSVLSVRLDSGGQPRWTTAQIDEDRRRDLRRQADDGIGKLRSRDPGGDIEL